MHAEVPFPTLLSAVKALKPYTAVPARTAPTFYYLHLRAVDDALILTATTGAETARVALPARTEDGSAAITPEQLIKALTVLKPKGRKAAAATASLSVGNGRWSLSVDGGPLVSLNLDAQPDKAVALPPMTAPTPVALAIASDWCAVITKVGWAAGRDAEALPSLAAVHLTRAAGAALIVEATDRYRVHRARWTEPAGGDPVDALMPAAAADRAAKLFTACDRDGKLRVEVDSERIRWQTDSVQLSARLTTDRYPNLDTVRDEALRRADLRFTADRPAFLAAAATALALAPATESATVRVEPIEEATVDISVTGGNSTVAVHRTSLPITTRSGRSHPLTFHPALLRSALAFLDGPHVDIAAGLHNAAYLTSGDREALVMQIRTP